MSSEKAILTIDGMLRKSYTDPETGESRDYFFGSVRSDLIKNLTFVPVKETSKKTYLQEKDENGYQRPGSAARMRMFTQYLEEHPLSVVPPVVLSARGAWRFSGKGDYGSVTVFSAAAIVDGQHRVGGYVHLLESKDVVRDVDVLILADLSLEEETEEFLAINNTQRGVPKSLNVLLAGSDESVIAVQMDDDADSPFHDKITQVTKKKGDLFTLAAMEKNIRRTFSHGAFDGLDLDSKLDIMTKYWLQIADSFPDEWNDIKEQPMQFKLLETTGLIAWSLAGSDILGPSFDPATGTMNWDKVRAYLDVLSVPGALDWRKDGEFQGLTGEVGGARIHKKIQQLLSAGGSEDDSDSE